MAKKTGTGVNKSEKVREYLADHPDAGATEVVQSLDQYGVSPALVYQIKRENRPGRRKKVRKKKAATVSARRGNRGRAAGRQRGRNEPVVAAAELIRVCGGVEEAKEVLEAAGEIVEVLR